MIIWGFDGNYKQLGEGPIGKCENCNNVVVFQVIQQSRRFKLYFVPVLKYNSQYWALCPTCTAGYQLPNKNDALALIAESNVNNQQLINKFMELDNENYSDVEDGILEDPPELEERAGKDYLKSEQERWDDDHPEVKEEVNEETDIDSDIEALEAELEVMKKKKVEAEKKRKEEEAKKAAELKKLTQELDKLKEEIKDLEKS